MCVRVAKLIDVLIITVVIIIAVVINVITVVPPTITTVLLVLCFLSTFPASDKINARPKPAVSILCLRRVYCNGLECVAVSLSFLFTAVAWLVTR